MGFNDFAKLCCFPNGTDVPGLTFGYIGTTAADRRDSIRAACAVMVDGTLWSGPLLNRSEYSKASRAVKAYRLGLEAADRLGDYKKHADEDRDRLANTRD